MSMMIRSASGCAASTPAVGSGPRTAGDKRDAVVEPKQGGLEKEKCDSCSSKNTPAGEMI
jgi:hypothetical protein